jgi:GNAT superfamily N-acetyltransferase
MADRISVANGFTIAAEPFDAPDSEALRAELAADLAHRYGVDSEPGAKPTGAGVEVFLVARGCGLARRLLASLEAEALARGLTVCRLETGEAQPEAMALYRRAGYREIEGSGVYAGMPLSRCFERRLEVGE